MNHSQHILITQVFLKNTEINLIHCTTLTTKMQHQKTLDMSIANPTLIFLYCLSNNVHYLQPVQNKYPLPLGFQEMPTHE